ncbi:MAG: terminase small subunit [Synergistales bacterium]|nr:terminase small subunit [Synergistales bacterium]
MALTAKQRAFVEAYDGNATEAAIAAGYSKKTAYSIGQENLKKPEIMKEIKNRESRQLRPLIWSREQRQKFWSEVANDPNQDMRDRLRASELLGKSECDFTDRLKLDGSVEVNILSQVEGAWKKRASDTSDEN